jgi:hypothetical protein
MVRAIVIAFVVLNLLITETVVSPAIILAWAAIGAAFIVWPAVLVLRDPGTPRIPAAIGFTGLMGVWIGFQWVRLAEWNTPALVLVVTGILAVVSGGISSGIVTARLEWRGRDYAPTWADFQVGTWARFGLWPFVPAVAAAAWWSLTQHWAPLLLTWFFGFWTLFCWVHALSGIFLVRLIRHWQQEEAYRAPQST